MAGVDVPELAQEQRSEAVSAAARVGEARAFDPEGGQLLEEVEEVNVNDAGRQDAGPAVGLGADVAFQDAREERGGVGPDVRAVVCRARP